MPPVYDLHPPVQSILAGHFHEKADFGTKRPLGRHDFLLIYTLDGRGRFGVEGSELIVGAGDVTVIRPSTPQDYGTWEQDQRWELAWAHFSPRPHWLPLLEWPLAAKGLMNIHLSETRQEHVTARFRDVCRWTMGTDRRRELFALNALEEILLWCEDQNAQSGQNGIDDHILQSVDFIAHHLSSSMSTADIAASISLSVSRFAHLFRRQMGMTPQQYVEQQRLLRAQQLLELTQRSVTIISEEVGFASPFYFSLRFKAFTGQSPTEFRERRRRSES